MKSYLYHKEASSGKSFLQTAIFYHYLIVTGILIILLSGCHGSGDKFIYPEKAYPALFKDVQHNKLFPDDKTFPDCIPKKATWEINVSYHIWKLFHSKAKLKEFVGANFTFPVSYAHQTNLDGNILEHLKLVSNALIVNRDAQPEHSSLIPLPYNFVIPGGRFRETYYWDTYFSLLGYAKLNRRNVVYQMTENIAYLIAKFGFVPNGNRSYYLSRSQPPFFSLMVDLNAKLFSDTMYVHFLPELLKEYHYWMNKDPAGSTGFGHIVRLDNSVTLNRYYDALDQPRVEMYNADLQTFRTLKKQISDTLNFFRNIRSTAESGWDFSSRWLTHGTSLAGIATINILPVDLNCLLYHLEKTIARAYSLENDQRADIFNRLADIRKNNINRFFWNDTAGYYFDYNFKEGKQMHKYTLAGVFPMFMGIASPGKALKMVSVIRNYFLYPGGVVTTLICSGQQWDAPNGWAPLQWVTIQALRNYHFDGLSDTITYRWLHLNEMYYHRCHKMFEKYNVVDTTVTAGGGEYPTQDGFGWTNGVYLDLTMKE